VFGERLTHADATAWPVADGWRALVHGFWTSRDGQALQGFLADRLAAGATIYPPEPLRALTLTPPASVRVVILGQDPYHGAGQAEGLAFSVAAGVRPPPSLRNIFVERQRDQGLAPPAHGSLAAWAGQGVLLLNTCLTVEEGLPASHAGKGWEVLTDLIIQTLVQSGPDKAFLLWGAHAQKKAALVAPRHLVCRANHPSPLSARRPPEPFMGCGHFGRVNAWLAQRGEPPIRW
jgi:uracil-DNA glycosylase